MTPMIALLIVTVVLLSLAGTIQLLGLFASDDAGAMAVSLASILPTLLAIVTCSVCLAVL